MKVVVTGGSGQLGTQVVRRLIQDRRIKKICNIDLRPPALASPKLQSYALDIRDPAIGSVFEGAEVLIHLAFVVIKHLSRAEADSINLDGSRHVFETARSAGVKQILYASSVAAYGIAPGHPQPLTEDCPRKLVPDFMYTATKYQVEAFLDRFEAESTEVKVVRFRPVILVGAYMEHPLGDAFKRRVLVRSEDVVLPMVWDEDVADAFLLALHQKASGAYNLTSEPSLTASELASASGFRLITMPKGVVRHLVKIATSLGRIGLRFSADPAWLEALAPMAATSKKAREELGWKPKFARPEEVLRHFTERVPRRPDRRIAAFLRLLSAAGKNDNLEIEARDMHARIHLQLTGPVGGDFDLTVDEGRMNVKAGVPRPPTAVIRLGGDTFLGLLSGECDVPTGEFTGRIVYEGDGHTAKMILSTISASFRATASTKTARGGGARLLLRWLSRSSGGAR